ncbi:energy-coupling factor transporter transmembrane component T [Nautilia lithotrophica]
MKNIEAILLGVLVLLVIDYKKMLKRSKRVIVSIFLFNLGVSVGYVLMGYIEGFNPCDYVTYINLKVFLMTYFVFWFFERVNVVEFFSFSKDLSYLMTMTLSQIFSYKKTFEDFRMAFRSRVISLKDKEKDFIANTFKFFFKKAMRDSKEKALAMRARGFFESEK